MLHHPLIAALILAGCTAPTVMQGARTLPEGHGQLGLSVEAHRGPNVFAVAETPEVTWLPQLQLYARGGAGPRSDCGVRIWVLAGKVDCKLQVLRTRFLDVAVAPGAGYATTFLDAHMVDGYLSAILGVNVQRQPFEPGSLSLFASATPIGRCFVAEGTPAYGCFAQLGLSGGTIIQLSPRFGIHLEVAQLRPLGRRPWQTAEGENPLTSSYLQLAAGLVVQVDPQRVNVPGWPP